ncbi:MAG: extracellular solute-binding protein [Lachnospiraceae bacterium]|nr:extracellular solute-binding protein [Lachnospiraceae bacterium]
MKKKIWTIGLFCILLIMLAGCGKNKNDQNKQQSTSGKDYVYKVTPLEFEGWENGNYTSVTKAGDNFFVYGYEYDDNGMKFHMASLGQDYSIKEENVISLGENESLYQSTWDEQGNMYTIKCVYQTEGDMEEDYQDTYYLIKMSPSGEEIFNICLNELPQARELAEESGWFYTGDMVVQDEFIYLRIIGKIFQFDREGNVLKMVKGDEENSFDNMYLYPLSNGKMAGIVYEDDGIYAGYVDLTKEKITQKAKLPGNSYDYSVYAGDSRYDLYLADNYGIYGYKIGDDDKTKLMDYIDSDLGVYSIYNIVSVNDREFFGSYEDVEFDDSMIGLYTKVDPKDVKDKETIVLACAGLRWEIRNSVVKFNKSNEDYRIVIQDYSALYDTEEDYRAGINRLNADIVSGKVPDILVLSSDMPVESYIAKGLFEDLKPYIEQDPGLDLNNFMPNIIEAFSTEGKLYRLVPYYYISTILAKTSDVGEERGWTIQDVNNLMNSKPEGTQFLNYINRDYMLRECMTLSGNQFIDWETGNCSFDSDSFIEMLEFLMQFPEEVSDAVYTDDYWNNYDAMWREGKVIAQIYTIINFRDYNYAQKGTFGEPVTMIGFPSANEDGSTIEPAMQLAMSSKSAGKEGAWQFLRYYLSDEYQDEITDGFPLSIKRLDELGREAMKKTTYIDEDGNEVEIQDYIYIGGVEVPIDPMTDEEVERFKKNLYSFTQVYTYDEQLLQILEEETAAYFGGQKNAKDVAKIIQSRAQIYVNENR